MSQFPPAHESFRRRLLLAIERAGYTHQAGAYTGQPNIYRLARVIDPDDPQRGERNLRRWLDPDSTLLPSAASRDLLSEALGVGPDFFSPTPPEQSLRELQVFQMTVAAMEERVRRQAWALHDGRYLVR